MPAQVRLLVFPQVKWRFQPIEARLRQRLAGPAVMLHLRACYVSKAAILTLPAVLDAGRKSKSRLNSKGLRRLSAALWRCLSLGI
jgi:hypothetical protein